MPMKIKSPRSGRNWHSMTLCLTSCLVCLLLCAESVYGQSDSRGDYEFLAELYVSPKSVENATGVPSGQDQISESQMEYGASLSSLWSSELSSVSIDYQYSETSFSKDSEEDGTFREGESAIVLGNDVSFYQLTLDHSIRRVLRQPNALSTILNNSEERQISNVMPLLRARFNEANSLALAYSYSKVKFEDSEQNSSERNGLQLQYLRNVSPLADFQLIAGSRSVNYNLSDTADYSMQFVRLGLSVKHRIFSYSLQAGLSKIKPKVGETENASTFEVTLNSEVSGNRFELFAERSVSDTSTGSGNDSFFGDQASFDGGGDSLDQVLRTAVGLSWDYDYLCGRCSFAVSIGGEKSEYFNLRVNDSNESFSDLSLGYQFSRRLMARANYRKSKTDFPDPDSLSTSSDSQLTHVDLVYTMNRYFEIMLVHERDERSGGGVDPIAVDTSSLTMTLRFE